MAFGITIGENLFNPKNGAKTSLSEALIYCKGFSSIKEIEDYLLDYPVYQKWGHEYLPAERMEVHGETVYTSTSQVRKPGLGCDARQILDYTYKMRIFEDRHLDDVWMYTKQKGYGVMTYVLEKK